MSVIDRFLKQASGNWVKADNCTAGDRLKITTEPMIDDETFDRPYLVCGVTLTRTSEDYKLRMGSKNVTRIAETLGKDEKTWPGRFLEVVSIESYPGLSAKGLLLRGLPQGPVQAQMTEPLKPSTQPQQEGVSAEAVNVIRASKDLIDLGYPLNASDWNLLPAKVRVELAKQGFVQQREGLYYFTNAAKKFLA